ncbi:endo-beta-N-acetylglucosaminidase [Streptomyces sp. NPDC048442]|uniref:endo-beta-N-acetylglucosaminidase n=1 Tax=Streptomyces sp. NPDC048442 TaxID=3154823 RepID=UPI003422E10E
MPLSRRALLTATTALGAVPFLGVTPAQAKPLAPQPPKSLQPYASYWFPDTFPEGRNPDPGATWRSLKAWRAADDPDLAFNTSTVPLATKRRFTPRPANPTARPDQAKISALVSFGPTTRNPSQGSTGPGAADYYALTHWAYLEELVFWGGSSGEGIILAPNAPVVDAAHRNGVRVLGNVFLPPVAYGGSLRWTRDLVQRDAFGRFPLVAQLIEVARTYGFDGWFINGETDAGGDTQLAADFVEFVKALRRSAPDLSLTWYDAFNIEGRVGWQGALNDKNAAFFQHSRTMFVDFRWSPAKLAESAAYAKSMGRSPYDLMTGVDVEANGWNTREDWDAIVPATRDHVTGLGLYRPEWTLHSLPSATRTPAQFHARDDQFWTGEHTDPTAPNGPGTWRPAAQYAADRSTVSALPFATSFNTGHGTGWYEDGRRTGDTGWNHLGLQDLLPSRRWTVRTSGRRPQVGFDFDAAWRGGSSLLVQGAGGFAANPVELDLYRTRLEVGGGTVELIHQTPQGNAAVEVTVTGSDGRVRRLATTRVRTVNGWTVSVARLPRGRSRTPGRVDAIGVRLTGAATAWRLGALSVYEREADAPDRPAAVRITDHRVTSPTSPTSSTTPTTPTTAELRLRWQPVCGARHYEVHQVLPDGARRFLGGTAGSAYYVPSLHRTSDTEKRAVLEVRAVGPLLSSSRPTTTSLAW